MKDDIWEAYEEGLDSGGYNSCMDRGKALHQKYGWNDQEWAEWSEYCGGSKIYGPGKGALAKVVEEDDVDDLFDNPDTLPPPEHQEPDPIEDEETWWQAFLDGRIRIPQLPKINWDPVDDK